MGCCGEATRVDSVRVNGKVLSPPDIELNGLAKNRRCTDIFFLILFIAYCIGGFIYLGVSFAKGDVNRLLHGYDPYGNICGQKNPKYFDIKQSGQDMTKRPYLDVNRLFTSGGITPSIKGSCTTHCGPNITLIGFFCVPNLVHNISQSSAGKTLSSGFQKIGININKGWVELLIICIIGIFVSILFTLMLRFVASILVWTTVAIIGIGSILATITLWILWKTESDNAKYLTTKTKMIRLAKEADNYSNILLFAAIVTTILTIVILVVLIALRKRIKLVIALFVEAGKVLATIPLLIIQPIWTMILMIGMLLIWLIGLLMILSAGDPTTDGTYVKFELDVVIANMRWYHLFGLFWGAQFLLGCQHVTIAGTVSDWYFTRDKDKLSHPILGSISRLSKYHLGSVALGSLILAIISLIRALLKQLEKRMKQMTGNSFKCLCCCCQCCMWAFDSFIKFLSKNAYIEMAIFGNGFCKSAQMSFMIIASNALKVAAITLVGDFLLFLVKIAIVIITVFIGIEVAKTNPAVNNIWPIVSLGGIFTFFIAFCFISVYDMTIDTLFLCFCEDHQRNNGIDKPYFMSRGLMKFVENSKAALDQLDVKAPVPMQVLAILMQFVQPTGQNGNQGAFLQPITLSQADIKSGTTPLHAPYKPTS